MRVKIDYRAEKRHKALMSHWYYTREKIKKGPVTQNELLGLVRTGIVVEDTIIYRGNSATGMPARNVQGLFGSEDSVETLYRTPEADQRAAQKKAARPAEQAARQAGVHRDTSVHKKKAKLPGKFITLLILFFVGRCFYKNTTFTVSTGNDEIKTAEQAAPEVSASSPAVKAALKNASDDTVLRFARLVSNQGLFLARKDPELCHSVLAGEAGAADKAAPLLPEALKKEEAAVVQQVLHNGAKVLRPLPGKNEIKAPFVKVVQGLKQNLGIDMAAIASPPTTRKEKLEYCVGTAELYKGAANLPANQGVSLIRYLSAQ